MNIKINKEEIDKLYDKMKKDIESGGYHFNPDIDFTKSLLEGLLINQVRYGYVACPCRLAMGNKNDDLDIICPCDYRDPDLSEFDACYCGLFVSQNIIDGKVKLHSIPERRDDKINETKDSKKENISNLKLPVWRCRVCGYLCARESPPEICPICKVKKERFERFI